MYFLMHLDASMAPRMDYDKVAVFEGRKVVEFDSPQDRVWTICICIWFPFCSFPLNFHWPVPCVLLSPWNQCRNWWRGNRSSNHLPKRVGRCEIIWAAAICAAFSDGQCDPYILWSLTFDRLWPSLQKTLKLGAKCGIFAERCSALTPSFQKILKLHETTRSIESLRTARTSKEGNGTNCGGLMGLTHKCFDWFKSGLVRFRKDTCDVKQLEVVQ